MTAQAADPRSLNWPKPGWSEWLPDGRGRIVWSPEEARIEIPRVAGRLDARRNAYSEAVERLLREHGTPSPRFSPSGRVDTEIM